jgi:hypothetical protein
MATVRIVHLSDLHFVPGKRDSQVWEMVYKFINGVVKPHAVLITGDVTDSAKQGEFDHAVRSLASLSLHDDSVHDSVPYRIVAGNHDRYLFRGNGPPPGLRWVAKRWWPRDKAGRFDRAFAGAVQVTPRSPCDMVLSASSDGRSAATWRIRVIGLDSSAEPGWFAQGAVSNSNIHLAADGARTAAEHDLVIAMVHHHLMPIPAVEQKMSSGGLEQVINATGMLNSGTLMDALSRAQVDLVLHGHEHAAHQASFSGSGELATRVALLAAGSATGDETMQGWDLRRVHFNVIELEDDRTVWLREVRWHEGGLELQSRRKLLDAKDIRLSRFVRRYRKLADTEKRPTRPLPRSRLRKLVTFRANRDIELVDTRTLWQVNNDWTPTTASGSGTPGKAIVEFDWADSERESFGPLDSSPGERPGEHTFALRLPPDRKPRLAGRVTTRWTWTAAAVFTLAEMQMLPKPAKGDPRFHGEEFASIHCSDEFEELLLSVRMPVAFSPAPATVRVYYEAPDAPGVLVYSSEFLDGLEHCGPGNFDLRIAYPMPGYRYGLSWPLQRGSQIHPMAKTTEEGLQRHYTSIQHFILQELLTRGWQEICRWSLYIPDGDTPTWLRQAIADGAAGPSHIKLIDGRGLARAALWGDSVVVRADSNNDRYEVLPDEQVLGYFAMRERRELRHRALAVLRVAFTSDPMNSRDPAWVEDFKSFAHFVALAVLRIANQTSPRA